MIDLDAGKYAAYVWPAFAVTAAVFAVMILGSIRHARRWRRRAQDLGAQLDVQKDEAR